jgi:hypothetical protein
MTREVALIFDISDPIPYNPTASLLSVLAEVDNDTDLDLVLANKGVF